MLLKEGVGLLGRRPNRSGGSGIDSGWRGRRLIQILGGRMVGVLNK